MFELSRQTPRRGYCGYALGMNHRRGDAPSEFQALADLVDQPVFVWNPGGEMLWVNLAFERETGMGVEDFRFRNEQNPFIHPDDLPHVLAAIESFLASSAQVSAPIENRFFDIWGRVRSLRSLIRKCTWMGNDALLLVSAITDTERASRETEQSYSKLIEAADDGILKLASNGCILYSNRRMQGLAALGPVDLARTPFADLFTLATRPDVERTLDESRKTGVASGCRGQLLGSGAWLDVKVTQLTEADSSVATLVIARDVTEMRRLEALALRREKEAALALLVGGVAHDLNNIVTGVLANTTFVEPRVASDGLLSQAVADIRIAGERAAGLGQALLSYLGQAPTEIRAVELDELVRQTVRVVRPLLGSVVEAKTDAVTSRAVIRGDGGQLGQVVMNLLTNAAQAMGERGGTITIETGAVDLSGSEAVRPAPLAAGRYAFVRVSDTGPGVAPDALERIFDPFFTTKLTGHGLGLCTALGVLRTHDGGIRVESQPGHGTTFDVYLPLSAQKSLTVAPASVRAPPAGATILVVDDEPAVCRVVQRILEASGAKVLIARSGAEALAQATACPIDAAIVDSRLPGENGPEIAAKLKTLRPSLRVLFSSGYQESPVAGDFLSKPYTSQQLIDAVGALLSSPASVMSAHSK